MEHQGIITEKRGEGNVGEANNDAKFLTSSWSSAHIPYNVWTWTISSSAKQRRWEERGDLAKKSNSCLANIEQQLMAKIAKKQQWPTGPMPPSCSNAKIIKKRRLLDWMRSNRKKLSDKFRSKNYCSELSNHVRLLARVCHLFSKIFRLCYPFHKYVQHND